MAKLRKVTITAYAQDAGKHTYDTQMEYNPNSQRFFIRVPKDQIDFIPAGDDPIFCPLDVRGAGYNTKCFASKTEDDVIEKAEKFYKLFLTAVRTERPVLFYRLSYYSEKQGLQKNNDNRKWSGYYKYTEALAVRFRVGKEVVVGGQITHHEFECTGFHEGDPDRYGDITHDIRQNDYTIVDHTPEREAFFEKLVDGMGALIQMIHDNTNDSEDLLELINKGGNLLTPHEPSNEN